MDFSKYHGIPISKGFNRNESARKTQSNKDEPPNSIMKENI